jgi:hypothetical protein
MIVANVAVGDRFPTSLGNNVCFGSKADISLALRHVHFVPITDIQTMHGTTAANYKKTWQMARALPVGIAAVFDAETLPSLFRRGRRRDAR